MQSRPDSQDEVPKESQGDAACVFVQDLMSQLEAFAEVERVSLVKEDAVSQLMPPCTQKNLERISEECGIDMPSKEAAKTLRASVGEIPGADQLHAEQLAARKKELVGKTVTGRLKPSHMGRRKGFFIKWNEHDNDTVFINKDRVEQYLGPNPTNGIMVSCTIVDLGPSWAPVDRQHPYTQAIVPLDSRWANRSPTRSDRGARNPSSKPDQDSVACDAVPSLETSSPTPEPATASPSPRAQLNWQKIKAACKKLVTEKQAAVQSWDMVKTAIPAMLEDKKEMPRNRRSSAFACRQHRRSDMGNAARSWRRGGSTRDTESQSSRGIRRPTSRAPLPRSSSMRGIRRGRTVTTERQRLGSVRRTNTTGSFFQ